ncbi:SIR2 family protein [Mycobacterium kubicae]|uniref:SIR2 family protein n=1 Tax=Mycobacterium kubicae TaxID=120959 RepID=UPI0009EF11DC|nr:SIR2 family protein [Mycobacterium kubicae]
MSNLIEHFPHPLLDELVDGNWLPIVGAGFSRNAVYAAGEAPADWKGLADSLAADVEGADVHTNPIEVLSAYEHQFGRIGLVDRIAALIRANDALPGPAHQAFAQIGFTDVITTNFDFLLEQAYEAVGKPAMPVVEEEQLASLNRRKGPRLIKLHGDLHHPHRMVITENDYDQFMEIHPLLATFVTAMLVNRTAVLIGYSLDDPDMRQLLLMIKRRLGAMSRFIWTIQIGAAPHIVSRYERRGVRVVNLPISPELTMGAQFQALFEELAGYWRSQLSRKTLGTDDRVTAEMRVPGDPSRMCYFAVPATSLGWYKDVVFAEVEAYGFIPVTAGDVIAEPGAVATMIEVLIDRAYLVVVELWGTSTEHEATLAIARKGVNRVLMIVPEGVNPPAGLSDIQYIRRPADFSELREDFLRYIREWLSRQDDMIDRINMEEPSRLLKQREYSSALISAVSLLEYSLTVVSELDQVGPGRRPGLSAMLRRAEAQSLFESSEERDLIKSAVELRNRVIHAGAAVDHKQASLYVSTILRFARRITDRY